MQSRSQSRLYQSKTPVGTDSTAHISAVQPSTAEKAGKLRSAASPAGSPIRARDPRRPAAAAAGARQGESQVVHVEVQVSLMADSLLMASCESCCSVL